MYTSYITKVLYILLYVGHILINGLVCLFQKSQDSLGDLLTQAKIRNKAKMVPHLIQEIDPAQLLKAKYGFIKGVEHNIGVYVYICRGYGVKYDSKLDAVCKSIMLYYIFHVMFPPAATACYRFLVWSALHQHQ